MYPVFSSQPQQEENEHRAVAVHDGRGDALVDGFQWQQAAVFFDKETKTELKGSWILDYLHLSNGLKQGSEWILMLVDVC